MRSRGIPHAGDEILWKNLFLVREIILVELERARQNKLIGKALEAKVTLKLSKSQRPGIADRPDELRELLNVSQLCFEDGDSLTAVVTKADGQKCERCWRWETDVGSQKEHPTICGRCVEAVSGCLAAREATSS